MIPRWMHRLYAWLFGYFWLPCPRCGEEFGGHEHSGFGGLGRSMTCRDCQHEGVRWWPISHVEFVSLRFVGSPEFPDWKP